MNDNFLHKKLDERKEQDALRLLKIADSAVDFCSNDYLGIIHNNLLKPATTAGSRPALHGSGGSRLLAGNYPLIEEVEQELAIFHEAAGALIFNSGYDANVGILSSVPQRGDTILYDHLSHASIRDGIRLSFAQSFSFHHNDMEDLEKKLRTATGNIFVVTESVFSMDGDLAPLKTITDLCERYGAYPIIDEAHAIGVIGERGEGLAQQLRLHEKCFARIYTFGKAAGCHGAVIAGSEALRQYLINFARSFIYTTSLPETAILAIQAAYRLFPTMTKERLQLQALISRFQSADLPFEILPSSTAIQPVLIPDNSRIRQLAAQVQRSGYDIRPILYPTVPKGSSRLRIVLHAFNTAGQLEGLISSIKAW